MTPPSLGRLLSTAQAHCKAGRLADALFLCEQLLQHSAANCASLLLLGAVLLAAGRLPDRSFASSGRRVRSAPTRARGPTSHWPCRAAGGIEAAWRAREDAA